MLSAGARTHRFSPPQNISVARFHEDHDLPAVASRVAFPVLARLGSAAASTHSRALLRYAARVGMAEQARDSRPYVKTPTKPGGSTGVEKSARRLASQARPAASWRDCRGQSAPRAVRAAGSAGRQVSHAPAPPCVGPLMARYSRPAGTDGGWIFRHRSREDRACCRTHGTALASATVLAATSASGPQENLPFARPVCRLSGGHRTLPRPFGRRCERRK